MRGLRITLDKSAVYGLNNVEVDSLDRYFFQVVPWILIHEILADLTKKPDPKIPDRIAAHTYRVSGNHGLTLDYRTRLANSLLGRENSMDGRFLASRETVVRTVSGSLAAIVETPLEDAILARWERREFTDEERVWARQFRQRMERPLNTKLYLDNITRAGLSFNPPQSDEELISSVNDAGDLALSLWFFARPAVGSEAPRRHQSTLQDIFEAATQIYPTTPAFVKTSLLELKYNLRSDHSF